MSHELDITADADGVKHASFVTANKPAWHRLGTVFPTKLTPEQALKEAHLGGWNVRPIPMFGHEMIQGDNGVVGKMVGAPDVRATVRTNPITGETEYLGTVGHSFVHVQNEEQVAFLQALMDEGGAFIETAGALKGGRQVFVTCKLPEQMLIGGVDRLDLYIAALNAHDGSGAFRGIADPIRIVCANTQRAALKNAEQTWSHRHTKNAKSAIESAKKALKLTWKYNEEFEKEAERMIQSAYDADDFETLIANIYGLPDEDFDSKRQITVKTQRLDVLRGLFSDAPTQKSIFGTRWAALQAIGEYEDHHALVKVQADQKDARRAHRAIDPTGEGVKRKHLAFSMLHVPEKKKAEDLLFF